MYVTRGVRRSDIVLTAGGRSDTAILQICNDKARTSVKVQCVKYSCGLVGANERLKPTEPTIVHTTFGAMREVFTRSCRR